LPVGFPFFELPFLVILFLPASFVFYFFTHKKACPMKKDAYLAHVATLVAAGATVFSC